MSGWRLKWPLALSIAAAWLLVSVAPLVKYLGQGRALVFAVIAVVVIVAALRGMERLVRSGRRGSIVPFVLLFAVLAVAFAVLYPRSLHLPLASRNDREDALRLLIGAILHHVYPYGLRTFLGNTITPLPGAALLALPFYAMGHVAWQNIVCLAAFFGFSLRYFRSRFTALFFLVLFVVASPSALNDLMAGGDYVTNFLYVSIAVSLFVWTLRRGVVASVAAAALVGVVLSSRTVYAVLLLPLFAFALQRTSRLRAAGCLGVVVAVGAAVTLPVFLPHPIEHLLQQMAQNPGKVRYLPAAMHPQVVLPLLGFGVAGLSFFLRMSLRRVFLVFSAATLVMLAPAVLALALYERRLPYEMSYLEISVLPYAMWALARYETAVESEETDPLGIDIVPLASS